jgi:hypothetical protein
MLCEKYNEALIEAAVSGDELAPDVSAHVTACTSCAAELVQQRSLVAAIDGNVSRQMNAAVPATMLQRLDARLAQQPQPKRTPRFAQIFAGSLATLAVAAIIFVFLPRWRIESFDPSAKPNASGLRKPGAGQIQVHIGPSAETPGTRSVQRQVAKPTHGRIVLASTRTPQQGEPEVLMPTDERIAFDQLIANLNSRQRLAAAISKPLQGQPEQRVVSITTPDIETAAVVVQPLREAADR